MKKHLGRSGLTLSLHMPVTKRFFHAGEKILLNKGGTLKLNLCSKAYFLTNGIMSTCSGETVKRGVMYIGGHCIFPGTFIIESKSQVDIVAVTNVELWSMPQEQFIDGLENIEMFCEVVRCVGTRVCALMSQLSMLTFADSDTRVETFIDDMNALTTMLKTKSWNLTQDAIAQAVCLHRVTVAKSLSHITKDEY